MSLLNFCRLLLILLIMRLVCVFSFVFVEFNVFYLGMLYFLRMFCIFLRVEVIVCIVLVVIMVVFNMVFLILLVCENV